MPRGHVGGGRKRSQHLRDQIVGEQWCVVEGFFNTEVSDAGRVRVDKDISVEPISHNGIPMVELRFAGSKTTKPLARLVLEAFVGPRLPATHVRHIDDDTGNNHHTNLRWELPAEDRYTADDMKEIRGALGKVPLQRLADRYGATRAEIRAIWETD